MCLDDLITLGLQHCTYKLIECCLFGIEIDHLLGATSLKEPTLREVQPHWCQVTPLWGINIFSVGNHLFIENRKSFMLMLETTSKEFNIENNCIAKYPT